jgi:hypothetical protein
MNAHDVNAHDNTPRYLGAAFLVVVVTSLVSGLVTNAATGPATGPGDIATVLTSVAGHGGLVHVAVFAGMLNAVGILVLAMLLYSVLQPWGRGLAATAVLAWTGESFFYALTQIASSGLAHVASDFQGAGGLGAPDVARYESLGRFLLVDVYQQGGTILMFFYSVGGLLFYYLFFTARLVPRWISGYGLAAVAVGLVGGAIELLGHPLGLLPYVAIGPFEIAIGLYLLVRGTRAQANPFPRAELVAS